jgi:ElaB/YqjD/DUF883 family membrane-anchored ribosome-binding protein
MANPGMDYSSQPSQTSAASDSYEAIKSDLSNLADTVKNLASEQLGAVAGTAQDQVKQKLGDFEASVRNNPTQAALIAAGVGFLVGLVMTR